MTKLIAVFASIIIISNGYSSDNEHQDIDIQTFLARVKRPSVLESWAKLKGTVHYKDKGKKTNKLPIELRVHLRSDQVKAQVIFNQNENFIIKQDFIKETSETIAKKTTPEHDAKGDVVSISRIGLRAEDLTLSFLYWSFVKELPSERVRGQKCRVVELMNKEKTEIVHVWISKKYYFPLRIKWFHGQKVEFTRMLDFTGFKKIQDMWIIKELKAHTLTGKSIVKFKDNMVELVSPENPLPNDLFIE